jgi:NagD protein
MEPKSYLIDMDGVLVRGQVMIPGADEFIEKLKARNIKFLVLTNNPIYTPGDLSHPASDPGFGTCRRRHFHFGHGDGAFSPDPES